jgi:predicted metal-dependent hydrolase
MADKNKKKTLFWINPNTRLCFPHFRIEWHRCIREELLDFCLIDQEKRLTYRTGSMCLHILYETDFSVLHFLYSDDINFENTRLQKWLRVSIRDAVMERARIVLPKRLSELEEEKQLWAKSVTVKKLRKGVLGQCSAYKQICLSPIIVIFPQEMMDDVILHEMAHLKYLHHRKSFWNFLSTLIGEDANKQKMVQDAALSKYWDLYVFLMK